MDAIYVVVNGESAGPYTHVQIRESLAKGEITRESLAWREGLAHWIPLGVLLEQASEPPVAPTAAITPTVEAVSAGFTKDELRAIARRLGALMWSVLASVVSNIVLLAHLGWLGSLIAFGILIYVIVSLGRLGASIRMAPAVLIALCLAMFLPYINMVILVWVSIRAAGILKANGVRVGLMGGRAEDIQD